MPAHTSVTIGRNISKLMKLNGIRVPDLAETLGVSASTLRRLLRGESAWYADDILMVCIHYDVTPRQLLSDEEDSGE